MSMSKCHLMDVKSMITLRIGLIIACEWGLRYMGNLCTFPSICYEFKTTFQKILVETSWETWHTQKTTNSHCILSFKFILVRMARPFSSILG